ncbi:TadE/TadG family type IV pilus assembly protein [Streptomyces glaucosporus]|uniref:TadE/TadG family type IV pilus assembly protein n=1 Tax=Streptomyces glaucosporus TaxID=284044 RepID=A0ABN3I5M5_9ACTN
MRTPGGAEGVPQTAGTAGGRPRARDGGQVLVEFAGFLPVLLVLAFAVVQLGVAAYTAQQAGTAARAAARMATQDRPGMSYERAGREAMSDWLADGAAFRIDRVADEVTVTARVTIPSVIPGIDDFGEAEKRTTMPHDD